MLARYHRWIFETCRDESVETLVQEAEFQTITLDTVRGLASTSREDIPKSKKGNTRIFFGSPQSAENHGGSAVGTPRHSCKICNRQHGVWACDQFKKMNQTQRWDIAKQYKVCYCCLGDDHLGQACTRTRICGLDGCRETHNRLLHKKQNTGDRTSEHMESKGMVKKSEKIGERPSSQVGVNEKNLLEKASMPTSNATEGELRGEPKTSSSSYTTTMASKVSAISHPKFIALRTVPVVLRNGKKKMVVNAVLDGASTKTYVNSDVAAELGLNGKSQKVKVNVLNGHVKTLDTTPIEVILQSTNGKVNMRTSAFTTERVTGNIGIIEWKDHAKTWSHLKGIKFPRCGSRPITDVLIGTDYADLHFSHKDVRGNPGESIAWLTPLGWTCVGNPNSRQTSSFHTNFA